MSAVHPAHLPSTPCPVRHLRIGQHAVKGPVFRHKPPSVCQGRVALRPPVLKFCALCPRDLASAAAPRSADACARLDLTQRLKKAQYGGAKPPWRMASGGSSSLMGPSMNTCTLAFQLWPGAAGDCTAHQLSHPSQDVRQSCALELHTAAERSQGLEAKQSPGRVLQGHLLLEDCRGRAKAVECQQAQTFVLLRHSAVVCASPVGFSGWASSKPLHLPRYPQARLPFCKLLGQVRETADLIEQRLLTEPTLFPGQRVQPSAGMSAY